jgi:hypothetical protein
MRQGTWVQQHVPIQIIGCRLPNFEESCTCVELPQRVQLSPTFKLSPAFLIGHNCFLYKRASSTAPASSMPGQPRRRKRDTSLTVKAKLDIVKQAEMANIRSAASTYGVQPSQIRRWRKNGERLEQTASRNPKAKTGSTGRPLVHAAFEVDWLEHVASKTLLSQPGMLSTKLSRWTRRSKEANARHFGIECTLFFS